MEKRVIFIFIWPVLCLAGCSLSVPSGYTLKGDGDENGDDGRDTDVPWDHEIPITCGDGVVDAGEECDDGNTDDGDGCDIDCTFSCHGDSDCRDSEICNGVEKCETDTHMCRSGEPSPDGFVCGDDPRSICLGHACVASECGDGFIDAGAGEFCDPPGAGGCHGDCTMGCSGPEDCPNDGNPCNGDEKCNPDTGVCDRTPPLADGSVCGEGPRRICLAGSCQESICGDLFVDREKTPPEECDDGNSTNGDGCNNNCTFSCHGNVECEDDNKCNGSETCDVEGTHTCRPGTNEPPGTACNDNRFCTAVDTCNGSGGCTGSGDPCNDHLDCTTDACNEGTDSCTHNVDEGFCAIDGGCHAEGAPNPEAECKVCDPGVSQHEWASRPDMSSCGTEGMPGICCGGACFTGGECCRTEDCLNTCAGEAWPCEWFETAGNCIIQAGCSWETASVETCVGALGCWDITWLDWDGCVECGCTGRMCSGDRCHCTGGMEITCNGMEEGLCDQCGCEHLDPGDGYCAGGHWPCWEYDLVGCETQTECFLTPGFCLDHMCIPVP